METNRNRHRRRSIRLQGFDYSQPGAYFITVCTRERACLFGDVVDGEMRLNEAGRIVEQCWAAIPGHFPNVVLDAFVVMPNHVHGIVLIAGETVGAKNFSPLPGTSAVGNVLFYERVGPRLAGMVLGMSFIVHQIGSAAGSMMASITFDRTGSYDGFLVIMGLILLASGLALVGAKESGERAPVAVAAASPLLS